MKNRKLLPLELESHEILLGPSGDGRNNSGVKCFKALPVHRPVDKLGNFT